MKKSILLLIGLVFLLTLLPAMVSADIHRPSDADPFKLVAGGGNPKSKLIVGTVWVWNDDENLYVEYVITRPLHCLTEMHLHVAASPEDIPQKNGNPIPGKFDYKMETDCIYHKTFTIPLSADPGTEIIIAAHAVVCWEASCPGDCEWVCETAWGVYCGHIDDPEYQFPGSNWATFIRYTVK